VATRCAGAFTSASPVKSTLAVDATGAPANASGAAAEQKVFGLIGTGPIKVKVAVPEWEFMPVTTTLGCTC